MLKPDYPLETERLVIRPFTSGDVDAVYAYMRREEVVHFLYNDPLTLEKAQTRVEKMMGNTTLEKQDDSLQLAVVRKDTGELAGDVMLHWANVDHRQAEVGYILNPEHGGHGFATEAAREMLRLGFDELDVHRIYGRLDARNEASAAVLRRLGMRHEAHLKENEFVKGEWSDEAVYAILESEWRALRQS